MKTGFSNPILDALVCLLVFLMPIVPVVASTVNLCFSSKIYILIRILMKLHGYESQHPCSFLFIKYFVAIGLKYIHRISELKNKFSLFFPLVIISLSSVNGNISKESVLNCFSFSLRYLSVSCSFSRPTFSHIIRFCFSHSLPFNCIPQSRNPVCSY